jgi:hypothetical protein
MSGCEIVMVRGVEDADGYPCGRTSNANCCDCGAHICKQLVNRINPETEVAMLLFRHEDGVVKKDNSRHLKRTGHIAATTLLLAIWHPR